MKKLFLIILSLFSINSFSQTGYAYFAELPQQLTFAGEKVPLEYADVRESLKRSMLTVMYMHSTTMQILARTTRYFPVVVPILKEQGIPEDFKYLMMAESQLNPNAASAAGARSFWQFIESTAKQYGLETGGNVDMRYDIESATRAACRYLKDAYKKYGSWTMAAASYNVGMSGVSNRASKQSVENYYDLHLPEETMRYVFNILAYKAVTLNPAKYGFELRKEDYLQPYKNFRYVEVSGAKIDWSQVAADNGTNYKMLRTLNPWIRSYEYESKSARTFRVAIPTGDFRTLGH